METQTGTITYHGQTQTAEPPLDVGIRHVMVVLNRALRSAVDTDNLIRERVVNAACVMKAASATETALVSNQPADPAFRIAARIVRRLRRR